MVGSWLLDLTAMALAEDPELTRFTGNVRGFRRRPLDHLAAIEEAVPCDVLSASLFTRFRSRQDHTFAEKMLSGMRNKFGGHVERAQRRLVWLAKSARSQRKDKHAECGRREGDGGRAVRAGRAMPAPW